MIIGSGDIASVLPERDDLLFFASGVSNSQETRPEEFMREADLLLEQDTKAHVVYFSSLAVFYGATQYVRHKKQMEGLVQTQFQNRTIVRLGNITWGTNPHTLINHMRGQVERGEPLEIQDTERYMIDQDEFLHWIGKIPTWNCELNITGRRMSIKDIVEEYVYERPRPTE